MISNVVHINDIYLYSSQFNSSQIESKCSEIFNKFDEFTPEQINKHRRHLFFKCSNLFEKFVNFTKQRCRLPIYYHHIPKSAGSYMCELFKQQKEMRAWRPKANCNILQLGPRWAGITPQKLNCPQLKNIIRGYNFFGNERFLDYNNNSLFCSQFIYAITIRNPIDRVISHFNHMRKLSLSKNPFALNNYLTWALVAGKMEPNSSYPSNANGNWPVIPSKTWLEHAQNVLYGYDFILPMNDNECRHYMLNMMGITNITIPKVNVRPHKIEYNRSIIMEHNEMDLKLYELSQQIQELDCKYFKDLFDRGIFK